MSCKLNYAHSNCCLYFCTVFCCLLSWQNACKMGWFSEKDTNELSTLANEVCYQMILFVVYIQCSALYDIVIAYSYLYEL